MTRRTHSFSLPIQVLDDLRRLAQERDESMSFLLREALRAYLSEHRSEPPCPLPASAAGPSRPRSPR